jgi:hypothetical protein
MALRIAASSVLLFLCALGATPAALAGPSTCTGIIAERNRVFDQNKSLLTEVSKLRRAVSSDESAVEMLSGGAQENAKNELSRDSAALKEAQSKQQGVGQKLKELDAEVARCQGRNQESQGGTWAGKWRGGNRDYSVFILQGRVYFNLTSPDKTISGQGSCSVSGSAATCDYEERYKSGSEETDSFGKQALTLSGDTIVEQRTLRSVQCYGGAQGWCDSFRAHIGQTVEDTWHRIKP